MCAGDQVKRIGRDDQPRQLAGSTDTPREQILSRRWFCAFSRRYGSAQPQLQRRDEYEHKAKCTWRPVVSMCISTGWSRQAVYGPAAMQNPRRADGRKTGAPSRFSSRGGECRPSAPCRRGANGTLGVPFYFQSPCRTISQLRHTLSSWLSLLEMWPRVCAERLCRCQGHATRRRQVPRSAWMPVGFSIVVRAHRDHCHLTREAPDQLEMLRRWKQAC